MSDKLKPCPFCGAQVATRKETKEVSGGNTMFVFSIEHSCGAIDRAPLSLSFQNATPLEECRDTLDKTEETYVRYWNFRPREERLENLLREAKGAVEQLRDVQNGCPLPSYEQAFALTNGEADKLILAIAAELEDRP